MARTTSNYSAPFGGIVFSSIMLPGTVATSMCLATGIGKFNRKYYFGTRGQTFYVSMEATIPFTHAIPRDRNDLTDMN